MSLIRGKVYFDNEPIVMESVPSEVIELMSEHPEIELKEYSFDELCVELGLEAK